MNVLLTTLTFLALSNTPAINTEIVHEDYRQTYYTYVDGDTSVGARDKQGNLITLGHPNLKVENNEMKYLDDEYGWLQVVAINHDQVKASRDGKYSFGVYGSIIDITYPDGEVETSIVLDACGACTTANKVDKWVYEKDKQHDIHGISFEYKRFGWEMDNLTEPQETLVKPEKNSVKTENKPIATSKHMEDVLLRLIKNNNDTLHEKANINGVMLK